MSHNAKHCYSSAGSHIGSHRVGGHHSDHVTSHHGGSYTSHHGGSSMSHHGGSHMSHHGGHHISNHRGHRMSSHGDHHISHHGGSHMLLHGGHHISNHGGSHLSHNGGQNTSHHGGHHMSHHGGSHMSSLGDHHTSHHGGHCMSSLGGSHISHHGGSHMSRHGSHHASPHGSSQLSHHGGSHMSSYGGHNMSHHGSHHISHHEGDNASHNGGHHRSHHGGPHDSHHGSNHISHHGGHRVSHHGSHHKKEVSFSKYVGHSDEGHHSSSGGHGGWKSDSLLGVNEKEIMQLLNERLSSYLSKVRSLEMENAELDRKIYDWYASNQPKTPPDGTHYYRIIDELQNQIAEAAIENALILLETDNARLAADDYKSRFEMEQTLASNVEMNAQNLEGVLEGLWGEAAESGMQVRSLQEERDSLRNNSEEEIESLLSQLGARINVELNAAPSIDLNEALSEIREEYENLMERNLRETASLFLGQSVELTREMEFGSEELQSIETELIELKRCMQALEIELQSELSLKSALEGTLAEMEATFGSKLVKLQRLINGLESNLAQILSDLERQNNEYRTLMNQKNHLEMEIATYKRLLDGHDIDLSGHHMSHAQHESHHSMMHHSGHHHGGHHTSGHNHGGHRSFGHHHHFAGHLSEGLNFSHHSGGHHSSGHQSGGYHSPGQKSGEHNSSGQQSGGHHSSDHLNEGHNSSGHLNDDHHSFGHQITPLLTSDHQFSRHSGEGHHSSVHESKENHSSDHNN